MGYLNGNGLHQPCWAILPYKSFAPLKVVGSHDLLAKKGFVVQVMVPQAINVVEVGVNISWGVD